MSKTRGLGGNFTSFVYLSPSIWFFFLIAAMLSLLSPNPLLTAVSILELPLLVALLWRRGEPPVLFWILYVQWIEVTAKVFNANIIGLPIVEMFWTEEIETAIWLGLIGILAVACGMHVAIRRLKILGEERVRKEAERFSLQKIWICYLVSLVVAVSLQRAMWHFPRFTEIFFKLSYFRWMMFFVLAYSVLTRKKKTHYLIIATIFEIIVGFTSYFARFLHVLFMLAIVLLTVKYRITLKNMARIAALIMIIILLSTFWMSIKIEYRDYLSLGTGKQTIGVSMKESLEKVAEIALRYDAGSFKNGFKMLVERVAHVDLFAEVLHMVPRAIAHEGGKLWGESFKHILNPRLFFPDKPAVLSPSAVARKYTGRWVAGPEHGTSISIGYMAESYVDFGDKGMFVPLFIIGLVFGAIYRYFLSTARIKIFAYGIVSAFFFDSFGLGGNVIMLVGGTIMMFIVMILVMKGLVPYVAGWLST